MRISKLLIILILFTFLSAQSKYLLIGNADTIKVNSFDNIETKLDSLLLKSDDIGKYFELYRIQSDNAVVYKQDTIFVEIDSLIFMDDDVRLSIQRQIFKSIKNSKPMIGSVNVFNSIISGLPFIQNDSKIIFGRYISNKLAAMLNISTNFNSYFSGLVGASRSDANWSVNGQINVHLENQWRTAGIVDLGWKRLDDESQLLRLSYEEPHPFGLPIGFNLLYNQDLREGKYVNTISSIGVIKNLPRVGKIGFGTKSNVINITAKGDTLGLDNLKTQSLYVSSVVDYRNDYWLPSSGYYFSIFSDVGNRVVSDSSSTSYSIETNFIKHIKFPGNTNFAIRLFGKGSWLNRGELHTGELIRYGGVNNLRGYSEDNFRSQWVIIPSFELSYDVSSSQRISLFGDLAFQEEYDPIPFGYGFGYTQVTKNSVLKLYYGLGRNDKISSGKIHLQFLTRL